MQTQPARTAAIILAAGSSSRIGQGRHKLLLSLGGLPVLAHVLEAALASRARPILVVLGHQTEQVRASLSAYITHPELTWLDNPDYARGMSSSLQVGLRAIMDPTAPQLYSDGALILLGDQPLLTARIIDTLLATRISSGRRIVAPLYAGKRGNPVLFDASLFPELLMVSGDEGGRKVIERHREEVASVELESELPSYDVDTWESYQRVVEEWQRRQQREEG